MKKLNMHSENKVQKNLEIIAKYFPNVVTEVESSPWGGHLSIDFELLHQELSDVLVEGNKEHYRFEWPGKRQAILNGNTPITATLRPCREESVDFDTTKNLYIKGDNLDVLKLLQETYLGKIRIIYIDPPYNTGSDSFVYDDDYSISRREFAKDDGQRDENGNLQFDLKKNNENNGRFHSDWLNMIYPRLKLARDLLAEDGIIFISIDDNEIDNLKKCCDEIFGRHNYLNCFAWVSNITGRQIAGKGAAKTWEAILLYAKNVDYISELTIDTDFAKRTMPDAYKGFNKDIREDERGMFAVGDTLYNHNRIFNEETRRNLVFSIYFNPATQVIMSGEIGEQHKGFYEIKPHKNGDGVHKYHAWRWSKEKINKENYNLIVLPTSAGGYEIYTKIRDYKDTLLKDLIINISNGDSEVQKLFEGKKCFSYPKSVDLLVTLLGSIKNKKYSILDFFSGSATTAHATMRLNALDNGERNYILVQLPEECDEKSTAFKAGYKNICEIGKERIRRAAKKIMEEYPDVKFDSGFRVLKLDSSNMANVYYKPNDTKQEQIEMFANNIKDNRDSEDLLFQVMLDVGALPSSKIVTSKIAGKNVFNVADNYLVACFDEKVTQDIVKAIALNKPVYAVFRDDGFANDTVAANCEQLFRTYSPDTKVKVL